MLGQIQKTLKQLSENQAKSAKATQSMAAMQASHNTPPNPLVTSYHTVSSQIGQLLDKKGPLDPMDQQRMQQLIQEQTGLYKELDKTMGGKLLGTQEENAPVTKAYLDKWLKDALGDELHGPEKDKSFSSASGSRPPSPHLFGDSPPATPGGRRGGPAPAFLRQEIDRSKRAKARKEADKKKQRQQRDAHKSPKAEAILERQRQRTPGQPHPLFNYEAWQGEL